MDISQIGAQSSLLGSSRGAGEGKELGQQQFLKLLVAQMQNQDPINPMDGKEFASQLAQFNSVEQLIGVNEGLASLKDSQELMRIEMTNSMASSLTGKQVRALSDSIRLESGKPVDINYELNAPAEEVEIMIKDKFGTTLYSETMNGAGDGVNSWSWNGKNEDGVLLPEGEYKVEIRATNGEQNVKARMFT